MSYGYPGGYGGPGGYGPPQGPPPGRYGDNQYGPPSGPPPGRYGNDQYGPPQGPPPGHHDHHHHHGHDEYGPPLGPPPRREYDEYAPPSGPPPRQQYGDYGPPSGPPPQRHYDEYGPPSGPPPRRNQYAPPGHPPPPFLDTYGYPIDSSQPPAHNYNYGGDQRLAPLPPHNPQQFGQGAPQGYTFQYSHCTGKRKALLIGINYIGSDNELKGCINDVHNVSAFLIERYGYKREDMVILTDDQADPVLKPTKANILRAMQWLVKDAHADDALFLHYSGHGGQTEDLDGDEEDGFDEVIYPVDFKVNGHIVDDQIHDVVVKPLMPGVRLTAIFDSCHSGSVMDLPYIYSTKGVLKEPNLAAEAGQGLLQAISAYAQGNMAGVASAIMSFGKKAYKGDDAYEQTKRTKTSPADVIMWSGSKDDQTSADATIAAQATGAMSWAFISAIKQNPKQSYVELLNSIRDVLSTKYTQKPQLSCSHPLDTNLLFVM